MKEFTTVELLRDPRRAYRIEETPPELAALLSAGLDRIIDGESGAGGT